MVCMFWWDLQPVSLPALACHLTYSVCMLLCHKSHNTFMRPNIIASIFPPPLSPPPCLLPLSFPLLSSSSPLPLLPFPLLLSFYTQLTSFFISSSAAKYSAEQEAKELKDAKEKQLKRIEEAKRKAKEPKGCFMQTHSHR